MPRSTPSARARAPMWYVLPITGWHVIYVSFVYDEGEVYENGFNWNEREEEGTFSYLFYESLKSDSSSSSSYASMIQNQILGKYNTDTCVTLYENRYKDLLSLDK